MSPTRSSTAQIASCYPAKQRRESTPLDAVAAMADICGEAEAFTANGSAEGSLTPQPMGFGMHTSSKPFLRFSWHAFVRIRCRGRAQTADEIGAKVIITLSKSGNTSRLIAKYRPNCPIMAVTIRRPNHDHGNSARRLLFSEASFQLWKILNGEAKQYHKRF